MQWKRRRLVQEKYTDTTYKTSHATFKLHCKAHKGRQPMNSLLHQ